MKVQIWLRPDQTELVLECLKFVRRRIGDDLNGSSAISNVAGPFTRNRLNEIIIVIEQAQVQKVPPEKAT